MANVQHGSSTSRMPMLRVLGIALAALILWQVFRGVRLGEVTELLQSIGPALLLAFIPFLLVNLVDAFAWADILRRLGATPPYREAFSAHLASEATLMSLPLGVVVAEPIRPFLLRRRAGVPISAGVASTAARKYLLMGAEGVVVAIAATLAGGLLASVSQDVLGIGGLRWITWGIAALLLALALGYAALLRKGRLAGRLFDFAQRFTPARFRAALERRRHDFTEVDGTLSEFFSLPFRQLLPAGLLYVLVWVIEAAETYLILWLLGVDVGFEAALALEAVLVFLRSAVAILPAGLGLQDLGYVLFLRALGVEDALLVGAAFSIIKRFKEALWIGAGYACLLLGRLSQKPLEVRV